MNKKELIVRLETENKRLKERITEAIAYLNENICYDIDGNEYMYPDDISIEYLLEILERDN